MRVSPWMPGLFSRTSPTPRPGGRTRGRRTGSTTLRAEGNLLTEYYATSHDSLGNYISLV